MKGFFDKDGVIHINREEDNIPVKMKGMTKPKEEEFKEEDEINQDRLKKLNEYSKKYFNLSIEQIAELIDSPDLKLGENYVIRKILEK